jgi:predicted nuclease with TOPRIM domain
VKREKRRLDDLLTIREDECAKLKQGMEELKGTLMRQNEEYASKLRRLEERYERATKDEKR